MPTSLTTDRGAPAGAAPGRSPAPSGAADWVRCAGCAVLVYGPRLRRNLGVCPDCGRHTPLDPWTRIGQLLDPGAVPLDCAPEPVDPLGFADTAPYTDRLARARAATGLADAVVCAAGTIAGAPVVAAVMDFRFLGGSLGVVVGEAVARAAEEALRGRRALVLVCASGGARMQEGAFALMQMATTAQALARLDAAGLLTVSVVTDPTYGGVAASFATLCDVVLAEPGARMGFAGPRVIEQTIRQQLPPGFQTAEFLVERGLIDGVCPRERLRTVLGRLLSVARAPARPGGAVPAAGTAPAAITDPGALAPRDAWESVLGARDLARPTLLDYLGYVAQDFEELRGDRRGGSCPAIVGGPARWCGVPVMVIGHQKGHGPAELTERSFGMARPAGYRRAVRLMRLAEKLGLPVVTLVDTPGAHPGADAEEQGQAAAIAECVSVMGSLRVPTVAVVTGEGGSGGALALAVADRVAMCENAVYSVISPEGCASILWKDAGAKRTAARALGVGARDQLRAGVVDAVVPEPEGGAGADPLAAARLLGAAVVELLAPLLGEDPDTLVARRRERFRRIGARAGARTREAVA
ncbi:acetyl-CoA carboxylase carboxyltransferase subunit alpha/beta [Streptomonospora nanhaiensis]|uniref:acetyl-CoA carboxylase carboxyltransferase subunit alpha/beta n=1 Tax=Streptomonospora nanhaiensis TaxID=1323731 RepID=UPI001C3897C7|nr:acetyl-CoA carboxylase carboxyltransferase subunit alpha/beta [Streptomonospora nanhaiensis]MBV2365254.1 acetyl-CoA carboxylase carboxyl transferase subunit beta [Streptomonospora nanhaiensis]